MQLNVARIFLTISVALSLTTAVDSRASSGHDMVGMDAVHNKISQNIVSPINVPSAVSVVIDVDVKDSGYVTRIKLRETSGYPHYDKAVMEAVIAAQPLPMPKNAVTREHLKALTLTFTRN